LTGRGIAVGARASVERFAIDRKRQRVAEERSTAVVQAFQTATDIVELALREHFRFIRLRVDQT
jgi:hypothetical protein